MTQEIQDIVDDTDNLQKVRRGSSWKRALID